MIRASIYLTSLFLFLSWISRSPVADSVLCHDFHPVFRAISSPSTRDDIDGRNHQERLAPVEISEYRDGSVFFLACSLLDVWRRPLLNVLKERITDLADGNRYYAAASGGNFNETDTSTDLLIVTKRSGPDRLGEVVNLVFKSLN